ncbi:hypothetical protein DAPPUDRAFT_328080 [Daphnia pulex]|uniref:Uncharacterized protein n=1 Tax=Daphnia pulex TaxID=6669 RepID=E9HCG3_DAPPU|nr:hypothetical protein DAPPUDRAFT_328080 [Daphnia pulex]|eukprot:EFX70510.1 hypothetical protein DAPPUDRAFT_328080 [Daphnia pulex]
MAQYQLLHSIIICLRQSLNLQLTVSLDTDNIHNKLTKPANNTANDDNNFYVIDTSSKESQQKSHDENEEQEPLFECSMNNIHEFIESIEVESLDTQQEENLKSSIPEWIIENRVPVSHASSLLKILHHEAGLTFLSLDVRKLLGSLRTKVQTTDMRPGTLTEVEFRTKNFQVNKISWDFETQTNGVVLENVLQVIHANPVVEEYRVAMVDENLCQKYRSMCIEREDSMSNWFLESNVIDNSGIDPLLPGESKMDGSSVICRDLLKQVLLKLGRSKLKNPEHQILHYGKSPKMIEVSDE